MNIKHSPGLLKLLHTPDKSLEATADTMISFGGLLLIVGVVASLFFGFKFLTGFALGFISAISLAGAIVYAMAIVGKNFKSTVKDKHVYLHSKGKGKYRGL